MKIFVNGKETELKNGNRLFSLLQILSLQEKRGIAVALNDEVIQKKNWNETELKPNDKILIIQAAQGGWDDLIIW